ncbi:MAG: beta-ketoacyl synthase N-terminal-like domain-containing protein, partial [Acidimicrobiales bacterium]
MPEAVIVSVARTPIGRAMKGSLKNERPDNLTAFIVDTALNQVPELDRNTIDDLLLGCGQPAGESGYNLARIVAIQAGMPTVPGVTINRYCSSSLMSIRMAGHAIKAGEGDAFIAAGVETVSRFMSGMADSGPHNEKYAEAEARSAEFAAGGKGEWEPLTGGLPDVYIAMGQTAENVASSEGVSREEQDEYAALSQQRATASLENGFWE